jgi:membrane-associated HD superfamily phosphohydrolase
MDFLFLFKFKIMASLLSTYTKEELEKKLKKQKTMLIIQGVVLFLMIIFAVFTTVENGLSFQTFLPLFFAPMLFVMLFEIKNIKKELALR